MGSAPAFRISLCADCAADVEDLRCLLEQAGFAARWHALEAADPQQISGCDLVIVDSRQRDRDAHQLCQRLQASLTERWLPIFLITVGRNPAFFAVGLDCDVDACFVRPLAPEEFMARVNTVLRWKRRHDGLVEKTAELERVREQLQSAYCELDQALELSRRIEHKLLPRTLPDVAPVRFAARFHSSGRVGGDLYHVFRLDDDHVAFYLADVVGHGVSASLLTLFLKQASCVCGLSSPHEVLGHLNRELLDLAAADNPLVTMVYALFDRRGNTLAFARAGSPPPIHVPRVGEPKLCQIDGTLLGVFDTQFATKTLRLRPGDKVLFHTDGSNSLSAEGTERGREPLLSIVGRCSALPVQEFVKQLFDRLVETNQSEDLTLLGLEISD
jgi:sigma-B regulation protein RsbU (phosphoserine phosphatase)